MRNLFYITLIIIVAIWWGIHTDGTTFSMPIHVMLAILAVGSMILAA